MFMVDITSPSVICFIGINNMPVVTGILAPNDYDIIISINYLEIIRINI